MTSCILQRRKLSSEQKELIEGHTVKRRFICLALRMDQHLTRAGGFILLNLLKRQNVFADGREVRHWGWDTKGVQGDLLG
jgi:hypothetical protein